MLEKGISNIWKFIKKIIKKECGRLEKTLEKQLAKTNRKKEGMTTQARGRRWRPGNTIRSKIEKKLTEEN